MAYDNIRLEKGMYRESGRNFSQVLEELDPSECYRGTALEGTDAFQRQLKRFGIRVRGAGSDRVEKFFSTLESAVLFPEFISRVVRQGMEEKVILSGDGNQNAATILSVGTSPISGTAGTLAYPQLIDLWAQFHPYEMNTMLVHPSMMVKLLNLPELQNPLTGLNFQGTGKLSTPLGADLLQTTAVEKNQIIAFDRRCTLEMVQAGDVCVEYDKLIDRQLERAAITSTCGFSKICGEAAKALKV